MWWKEGSWATIVRGDVNDVTRIHHAPGARATAVLVSLLCDAAEVDDRSRRRSRSGEETTTARSRRWSWTPCVPVVLLEARYQHLYGWLA